MNLLDYFFSPQKSKPKQEFWQINGISFQIKRVKNYKSLKVELKPHQTATVKVNYSTGKKEITSFILKNLNWIYEKQEVLNQTKAQIFTDEVENSEILFDGKAHKIRLAMTSIKKNYFALENDNLTFFVKEDLYKKYHQSKDSPDFIISKNLISQIELRKLLKDFYLREAKRQIFIEMNQAAVAMSLSPRKVTIRFQKSRWGSCTSRGDISVNAKLMMAPKWVRESVYVHELCHLQHLNHSKDFWVLVRKYAPNHKEADKWLRQNMTYCHLF